MEKGSPIFARTSLALNLNSTTCVLSGDSELSQGRPLCQINHVE